MRAEMRGEMRAEMRNEMRDEMRAEMRVDMRVLSTLCALCFALTACRSTPEPHPLAPRPVRELERWSVHSQDGRALGCVTLLEIDDPRGAVRMYWAENESRQSLGFADDQGRFYRRLPFVENERFVGMYPMAKGLAVLYEQDQPVRVVPFGSPLDGPLDGRIERLMSGPGRRGNGDGTSGPGSDNAGSGAREAAGSRGR